MKAHWLAGFALFLLASGCTDRASTPTPAQTAQAPEPATSAATVQKEACPSQDFDAFLKAFANDAGIQKAFVRYPYTTTVYDPTDLEADPSVKQLGEGQVTFPVMLSESDLVKHGASMQAERKAQDWYEVSTQSDGSGAYTMTFNFRHADGCWFLTDSIEAST